MTSHFDTIITGAGQAGPSLAGKLTGAGGELLTGSRIFTYHLYFGDDIGSPGTILTFLDGRWQPAAA